MLIRCAGASEPGIIGYVHQQFGALEREPPGELREDRFITDEGPHQEIIRMERLEHGTGRKVTCCWNEPVHKGEETFQRDILTKGKEVYLIVGGILPVSVKQIHPVVIGDDAILCFIGRGTEQQVGAGYPPHSIY